MDDVIGRSSYLYIFLQCRSMDQGTVVDTTAQGHDNNPVLFDAPAGLMSMQLAERSETFCSSKG